MPQQPVDGSDVCPICLDPMTEAEQPNLITFCRVGCGNNVHVKCMLEYAEHQVGNGR